MSLTPTDPKKRTPPPTHQKHTHTHTHKKKIISLEVCPTVQSLLTMNFLGELFNLQQQAPTCK
jgi:hypothetical protein